VAPNTDGPNGPIDGGQPLVITGNSFVSGQTSITIDGVPVLTSSVTLWLLITLLALWAIRRRRARDAALRRIWEEEEERARLAAAVRIESENGEWVN